METRILKTHPLSFMFGGWRAPLAADPFLAPSLLLAGKRVALSFAYGQQSKRGKEGGGGEGKERQRGVGGILELLLSVLLSTSSFGEKERRRMLHLLIAVTFSLSIPERLKLLLASHLKSGLYLHNKRERQISVAFSSGV